MSALLAALYAICILFLCGSALFVLTRSPRSRLHRYFALLALALLGWVASLFAFGLPLGLRLPPADLLLLGRFNFASVVLAATLAFLFVRQVAGRQAHPAVPWLWAETAVLAGVTLLTPLVDRQELVRAGEHVTVYGPLFVPYILHMLATVGAALSVAFHPPPRAPEQTRRQLRLVGYGIFATVWVALVTDVILPYAFGEFRLIHVGTLSTALFLAAVGYAVFAYHLFSVRLIVRATFVFAGLVALALELYSLALSFLAHLLPLGNAQERGFAATALVLVVNAFTQGPVKRWLEQIMEEISERGQMETHYRTRSTQQIKRDPCADPTSANP